MAGNGTNGGPDAGAIRRRAERWASLLGADAEFISGPEGISDAGLRARVSRDGRIRGWETPDGRLHVYLPGMASVKDADNLFMHDVVAYRGLGALLGRRGYEEFLLDVWGRLYDNERQAALRATGGDPSQRESWLAAAEEYVGRAADRLADPKDGGEKASRAWDFIMGCFYRTCGSVPRLVGTNRFETSNLLSSGVRHIRRVARLRVPDLPKDGIAAARDADFSRLEDERWDAGRRDMGRVLRFGYPGRAFLSCYPKAQRHPLELPLGSLFGEGGEKQVRHPYSFASLRGLSGELERPLAVFDSRDLDKPKTLVVLTRLRGGYGHKEGNFVVPVTPTRLRDGLWVNRMDSVYPKPDLSVVHWLVSARGLVRYIDPSFGKEFLEPVRARVEAYYAEAFAREEGERRAEGTHQPGADEPAFRPRTAQDSGKSDTFSRGIGAKIANNSRSASVSAEIDGLQPPIPLRDEYAMVLSELEQAEEVVRSFVNPPLPEEDVRFFQDFSQKALAVARERNAVSIYNFLTDDEKVASQAAEYRKAVLRAAESGRTAPVHAPRMVSGMPVSDAGAVQLRLGMMANPDWTPFFLTRQQAHAMGLAVTAPPTPVVYYSDRHSCYMRGTLYNLSDTDFPAKYPDTYAALAGMYSGSPGPLMAGSPDGMAEEALRGTYDGTSVRRYLTEAGLFGACGEPLREVPSAEALAEELDAMGDHGVYRLFDSVGTRVKKAVKENHLLPERLTSLDEAILRVRGARSAEAQEMDAGRRQKIK